MMPITLMSVWSMTGDLPVRILAVAGGAALGGFLTGWGLQILAKMLLKQKAPGWMVLALRALGAVTAGLFVYVWLFGSGGGGGGGGGGLWPFGRSGKGGSSSQGAKDKGDGPGKGKQPEKDPKKDPKEDPKENPKATVIGQADVLLVEVLGNQTLDKINETRNPKITHQSRYRVRNPETKFFTREELKKLIEERQAAEPPIRGLLLKQYPDTPDDANYWVSPLKRWAEERKLEVSFSTSSQLPALD